MDQSPAPKKEKIFFPNLDGLRFFSFFTVYLFHIYLLLFERYHSTGTTANTVRFLFQNGEIGVNFFFVLSGFLITYLLIEEKRFTGKIHIGNFYVRRVLRIWPLFYLCLLFGLVVYPFIKRIIGGELFPVAHPWTYFVFLNNFDFLHYKAPAIISVLWSVAVEEQFYLFWPLILSIIPLSGYKYVFYVIILGSLLFRVLHAGNERVLLFHTLAVIGDMALGGLLAYYTIFNTRFKQRITTLNRAVIFCIYLLAAALLLFRKELFAGQLVVIERLVIGVVFGFIILEQNFSSRSFFKMASWRNISRLGTYTYGLYCLHIIAMTFTEIGFKKAGFNMEEARWRLATGAAALVVSIVMALLSYHFYEKRFLRLKERFAFITKH